MIVGERGFILADAQVRTSIAPHTFRDPGDIGVGQPMLAPHRLVRMRRVAAEPVAGSLQVSQPNATVIPGVACHPIRK